MDPLLKHKSVISLINIQFFINYKGNSYVRSVELTKLPDEVYYSFSSNLSSNVLGDFPITYLRTDKDGEIINTTVVINKEKDFV
jgi:hypothetical protein